MNEYTENISNDSIKGVIKWTTLRKLYMFHNVGKGMPKYICLMRYNTKNIYMALTWN